MFITRDMLMLGAIILGSLVLGGVLYLAISKGGMRIARRTITATDDFMVELLARAVQIGVYIVALVFLLDRLGVNVAPLITGAGVFGIIIAIIGRDLFANTLAGLWIINEHPFDVGHRILLPKSLGDVHGTWGDVVGVGLRSTFVRSVDGVLLTIPNSSIVNDTVANFGGPDNPMRARIRVGVMPGAENVQRALHVADLAIRAVPEVINKPKPVEVLARDFRDHDVLLEARFFVANPASFRPVKSAAILAVLDAFAQHGVALSTPRTQVALDGEREAMVENGQG